MRIVITGASGNVGTALLRRLTADGHDITGVVRRLPDAGAPYDRVSWVSADLTEESCAAPLRQAFTGADAVVHLAWGFQPSHDLAHLEELGVGGTRRVLDAVAAADVPHLVHMSSVGAYSPKVDEVPVDESWPTEGIPGSPYSRHKAAAERLLDTHEQAYPRRVVTRMRPGIVGQRQAGSALLRYGLPAPLPAKVIDLLPVLPLDRRLAVPMVHADDVADAFARVLEARAPGAFNLSAGTLTPGDIGRVLGARPVHVPAPVVRTAASLTWHARLQQVDPGWVDLAFSVPVLDSGRAARELGWRPAQDAEAVLAETVAGMRGADSDDTPVLRRRTVRRGLAQTFRDGPVSSRRRP
ncbi:NAD-dependent epimerase/dehydratase family protein [Nocardioides pacificus]